MEKTMHLFDAISEMRILTKQQKEFSIAFMSHDRGRQKSSGLIEIGRAQLRASTPEDQNKFSDYMLNYLDKVLNRPGQLWQPCLMYFNEYKIEL